LLQWLRAILPISFIFKKDIADSTYFFKEWVRLLNYLDEQTNLDSFRFYFFFV